MNCKLVLNCVDAGFPSPAEEYLEGPLDLNRLMIRHPVATFFVRVQGNSMEGAGIFSGDILVVDRAERAMSGKIIVATIQGEFTVKRLVEKLVEKKGHDRKKKLFLVAENKDYAPIEITPESDFQVWGVVTWVLHKTL